MYCRFLNPPLRRLSVFFSVACLERCAALFWFFVFGVASSSLDERLDLLDASFLLWAALRAKMVDMARSRKVHARRRIQSCSGAELVATPLASCMNKSDPL